MLNDKTVIPTLSMIVFILQIADLFCKKIKMFYIDWCFSASDLINCTSFYRLILHTCKNFESFKFCWTIKKAEILKLTWVSKKKKKERVCLRESAHCWFYTEVYCCHKISYPIQNVNAQRFLFRAVKHNKLDTILSVLHTAKTPNE